MQANATVTNFVRQHESIFEELLEELELKGYKIQCVSLSKLRPEVLQENGWKDGYFIITNNIFLSDLQVTLSAKIYQEIDGSWHQIHEI